MYKIYTNNLCWPSWLSPKILLIMKLTMVLIIVTIMQVSATGFAQKITLKQNDISLEELFKVIRKQTGYNVLWVGVEAGSFKKIDANFNNIPLNEVLEKSFENQSLAYEIENKTIIVRETRKPFAENNKDVPSRVDIRGRVIDSGGKPLPGASVKVKSTGKTVITDTDGNFQLKAIDEGAILEISFIGYVSIEIKADKAELGNIELKQSDAKLDEIVVVGYGTQKKASLTSAVTTINTKEMTNIPASNLSNILAGRASGVFVETATGIPGKSSAVRIRSSSSWNDSPPLFVIDGVVRDQSSFDALDPSQIDNLSILKDAASTAIYGSRASNGVLLVTTKGGKKGKLQVQFNSVAGINSKPAKQFDYMPLLKAADIVNDLFAPDVKYNDFDKEWIAKNNPDGRIYFNEVYQKPFTQKHGLNISGGSDDVTYFIGGNYFDEKGFLPQLNSNKYNFRGNISANLNKDWSVGLKLNFNNNNRRSFVSGLSNPEDFSGFYEKLFYLGSGISPAYIDGKPVDPGWLGGNPIEVMRNGGYSKFNDQQIDALITSEYKVPFINGLTLKMLYSKNFGNSFSKAFAQKHTLYKFQPDSRSEAGVLTNTVTGTVESGSPITPFLDNTNGRTSSYQLNGMITYDKKVGQHTLSVLAGYEQSEGNYTYSSIYRQNFPYYVTDQFPFTSQAAGDTKASGFETNLPSRVSYIGRLNYDFAGKYLASFSLREDGSSNFAKDKRWGLFPAASAAWIISSEPFFAKLDKKTFVDVLKLRMSYGTTGNDPSFNWLFKELYNASNTTFAVGDPVGNSSILSYNGISNVNYTWETSKAYNVGLDFGFLQHWNLTTEFWSKKTYDILGKRILNLPVEFGTNYPPENYGKMNAKGIELELSYMRAQLFDGFEMNASANFGLATTEVVRVDAPANSLAAENPNGKPLNAMVGYHSIGIFRSQNDLNGLPAGYTIFGAAPELGMMNFEDVSGPNGKADGKIDTYDKILLAKYGNTGNTASSYNSNGSFASHNAPISFGLNLNFNYKGFSLDMLWGGLAGYKILYNDPWGRSFPGLVAPAYYEDAWTSSNPNGKAPKIFRSGDPRENGYKVASNYNIYDGSFVRLKNLQLSYDLNNLFKGKAGFKSAKIFVGATNLFTISKFKYYDPETFSGSSYPVMRTVTTGLSFQF